MGKRRKKRKYAASADGHSPEASFEKKAHAISDALGNKTLIITEECDDCNWKFSQTIEPDLVDFLAMYRVFYGIKGKGGIKEFKGKNFKIFKDETVNCISSKILKMKKLKMAFPMSSV